MKVEDLTDDNVTFIRAGFRRKRAPIQVQNNFSNA